MDARVTVSCVVCGGDRFETVCSADEICAQQDYLVRFHRRRLRPGAPRAALADRANFTQDYVTDVVACTACGLVLRNPRPSDEAIRRAYAQDDYGPARLDALFESQRRLFRPKARRLAHLLRPGARVVEVGSFVGGFLAAGQERGWALLGVDPGEEVDAFCAERALPVFRGTLADAPLDAGTVDCVAIWNTFDQLPDPGPTLSAARRLLRPGGLLVMRVPNGRCFWSGMEWLRRHHSPAARPLRNGLLHALAWNNLLAFPYLYGYSAPCLDRLMSCYDLRRLSAEADTLVRLADEQTKGWAAWEERALKLLCRLEARLDALRPRNKDAHAPWLDVYYRLPPRDLPPCSLRSQGPPSRED